MWSTSCTHGTYIPDPINTGNGNGNNTNNDTPCDPDSVYFVNDIQPILTSNCTMSGCHDVASHQDGVVLTDYSHIISTTDVDPGSASKSHLYKVLIKTDPDKIMPRPPMNPLNVTQISLIKKWIDQGAKNNSCSNCDTTAEMKYSLQISSILQTNCVGCHSGASPSGNIDLSNYTNVSMVVSDGRLVKSINHITGVSPMPKNGNKLSDCTIYKIEKWIQNGAENN